MNIIIKRSWATDERISVLNAIDNRISDNCAPGEFEAFRLEINALTDVLATLIDILADSKTIDMADIKILLNEYEVVKDEA